MTFRGVPKWVGGGYPIYDIFSQQNLRRTFRRNKIAQVKLGPGQTRHWSKSVHRSESGQVRIGAGRNRRRKKNELTICCIRRELKIKIVRKLLRLMVTRYVWNMIAFLRCHYAYLSIILTRLKSQFCARLLSKKINISSK